MEAIHKKFIHYCQQHDLIGKQERVLVGVSGGMDSMALIHILMHIQAALSISLAVCHVHHGLRGKSADWDENLVRDYCAQSGLPFYGIRGNAVRLTKRHGLSPEEGARNLRHTVLEELRNRIRFDSIALAHQADDQAETILMNLARGSGIRGMGGIRPRRDRIIHPLLFASREDIQLYIKQNQIPFRNDPTNRSRMYRRNQIRLNILEPLKTIYGPGVIQTLGRSGVHAQEIMRLIQHEKDRAWQSIVTEESGTEIILDIYQLLHYFTSIQKELFEHAIRRLNPDFTGLNNSFFNRLFSLVQSGKNGRWMKIDDAVRAAIHANRLVLYKAFSPIQAQKVELNSSCIIGEYNQRIITETYRIESSFPNKRNHSRTECLDFDKIEKPLVVRSILPGDWFIPLGMKGRKKVKDFYIDEKIPFYKRQSIPLLIHGKDIACVLGHRLDDRYKVTPKTKRILKIKLTG